MGGGNPAAALGASPRQCQAYLHGRSVLLPFHEHCAFSKVEPDRRACQSSLASLSHSPWFGLHSQDPPTVRILGSSVCTIHESPIWLASRQPPRLPSRCAWLASGAGGKRCRHPTPPTPHYRDLTPPLPSPTPLHPISPHPIPSLLYPYLIPSLTPSHPIRIPLHPTPPHPTRPHLTRQSGCVAQRGERAKG